MYLGGLLKRNSKQYFPRKKKIRKNDTTVHSYTRKKKKDCELKPIIKTTVLVNVGFGLCGDEVNYISSILQLPVS